MQSTPTMPPSNKRRASSPAAEEMTPKKQKLDGAIHTTHATPVVDPLLLDAPEAAGAAELQPQEATGIDAHVGQPTSPMADDKTTTSPKKTVSFKKSPAPNKTPSPKNPAVQQGFSPWKPTITAPAPSPFWGIKPKTGDPLPHPNQPSARDSDAATNPPMWEDRGFRIKRGSRYVKYFGPMKPEGAENGPDLDQEDLLVVKLIDMRATNSRDKMPRCKPIYYAYEHGKPKNWDDMQTIKALNDRRGQAIDRMTLDTPWSRMEREYLAQLFREFPDGSIWDLTMRFNDRFMDQDHTLDTAFSFNSISTGRTVESVRHQYMTFKPAYDAGEMPPAVRFKFDPSLEGNELRKSKKMEQVFGPSDKKLENEWDADKDDEGEVSHGSDSEEQDGTPAKMNPKNAAKTVRRAPPKKRVTKKSQATVVESNDEMDIDVVAANQMAQQPKLADEDEEVLELAGAYRPKDLRISPPYSLPPNSPPVLIDGADSPLTELGSAPLTPTEDDTTDVASAIGEVVVDSVGEIVNEAVEYADEQKRDQRALRASISQAVNETARAEIMVDTTVTETTQTVAIALLSPDRGARNMVIDEIHDDDDEEV
jgi:hypothetical protein